MITADQLRQLAIDIHQSNVEAGWWSDLQSGESILKTRNRAEVMMLIQSEYMEAWEGLNNDLMDDKLPQYKMFDVELADAVIRLLDLIGAEQSQMLFEDDIIAEANFPSSFTGYIELLSLMAIVNKAFENYRKGHRLDYRFYLCAAVTATFDIAKQHEIPLLEIIAAKRSFNSQRADHKRESRLAEGGKAI